jgi:hypothetical protein
VIHYKLNVINHKLYSFKFLCGKCQYNIERVLISGFFAPKLTFEFFLQINKEVFNLWTISQHYVSW